MRGTRRSGGAASRLCSAPQHSTGSAHVKRAHGGDAKELKHRLTPAADLCKASQARGVADQLLEGANERSPGRGGIWPGQNGLKAPPPVRVGLPTEAKAADSRRVSAASAGAASLFNKILRNCGQSGGDAWGLASCGRVRTPAEPPRLRRGFSDTAQGGGSFRNT